jgi:dTDP-4-amino-4,6-dideoxygalactose transaminase
MDLEKHGVSTVIHYPIPSHRQACYQGCHADNLSIAEMLAEAVLSLPMSPAMRAGEVERASRVIVTCLATKGAANETA